jgi:small conductance mechanosensitive channel
MQNWIDLLKLKLAAGSFKVTGGVIILLAGVLLSKWIGQLLMRGLMRREMEPPVRVLIVRVVKLLVFILTALIALSTIGMDVMPLVTGLGVAGVGIGLALQGVLGNLVAGLFIILAKPFRVGEYIEIHGVQGEVMNIELFSTFLLHPDRSRIVIPNRKIVGEILHNFGAVRQLSLGFSVAYDTNLSQAQEVIRRAVAANPRVIKDPAAFVGVTELGASAITIAVKPWVSVKDYGMALVELNQDIFEKLVGSGVSIPFPQQEIRLLNESIATRSN